MATQGTRKSLAFKVLSLIQAVLFVSSSFVLPVQVHAQSVMELPAPGSLVNPSMNYVPVILRAVKIHPDQPLVFDFMVDSGNTKADQALIKTETQKLVKYFLASLTIPETDLWVNLSPYEHDRIVPEVFGQTEMGRDLLAQDYVLKQLTASLVDPEKGLGQEFWSRVYAKVHETLGTREIPVDTFNKVWIMPDKAEIYEMDNTAIVGQSRLKVLMEEDYLALQQGLGIDREVTSEDSASRQISNDVMRQIILPEIEKEVNEGKNFALLRQVYQSLVLAAWYKNNLKESLLSKVYADQNKTAGMNVDKADKEAIYQRYIAAYKQGVFNYIKEEVDPVTNEVMPRKYFSGGANFKEIRRAVVLGTRKVYSGAAIPAAVQMPVGGWSQVTLALMRPVDEVKKLGPADMMAGLSDRARTIFPDIVMANIKAGVFSSEDELKAFNVLADAMDVQSEPVENGLASGEVVPADIVLLKDVFSKWDLPGINDAKKIDFIKDVLFRNNIYPTGLSGYAQIGREKNLSFAKGDNPFSGKMPERVVARDLTDYKSPEFLAAGRRGVAQARFNVYAAPVGGRGERLGAEEPRVTIAHNTTTNKPYLQELIEKILIAQNESNHLAMQADPRAVSKHCPLILMTSDATHDSLASLLKENSFYGMNGMTVVDVSKGEKVVYSKKNDRVMIESPGGEPRTAGQIILVKQEDVPSMFGAAGQFYVSAKDIYKLDVKPHNHGDLHSLIKMAGLAKAYKDAGFMRTVVFQDTNGEVFNGIFPAVGSMLKEENGTVVNEKKLNVVAVKLNPGDKVGTLVRFKNADGTGFFQNVEYNQRDLVFKKDPKVQEYMEANGLSPNDFLSGNINVYIMDQERYDQILDDTKGVVNELVNPKANKTSRLEAMMQDIYIYFQDQEVMVSNFDTRFAFNAVKNGLINALAATSKGLFSESMISSEGEEYVTSRQMAAMAGMLFVDGFGAEVAVEGKESYAFPGEYVLQANSEGVLRAQGPYLDAKDWINDEKFGEVKTSVVLKGVPYRNGAKIDWDYLTPAEVKEKVKAGRMTERSVLVVNGVDVRLHNVDIDGTLVVNIKDNLSTVDDGNKPYLIMNGVRIRNAGWSYVDVKPQEMASVSSDARMRGVYLKKNETAEVTITGGTVEIRDGVELQGRVSVFNDTIEPIILDNVLEKLLVDGRGEGRELLRRGSDGRIIVKDLRVHVNVAVDTGVQFVEVFREDSARARAIDKINGDKAQAGRNNEFDAGNNWKQGGIDFNPASLDLNVTRTGKGIQVQFDPAEIQRIKAEGVSGFTPVIINITPVKSMLPALGLAPAEPELAGAAS